MNIYEYIYSSGFSRETELVEWIDIFILYYIEWIKTHSMLLIIHNYVKYYYYVLYFYNIKWIHYVLYTQ